MILKILLLIILNVSIGSTIAAAENTKMTTQIFRGLQAEYNALKTSPEQKQAILIKMANAVPSTDHKDDRTAAKLAIDFAAMRGVFAGQPAVTPEEEEEEIAPTPVAPAPVRIPTPRPAAPVAPRRPAIQIPARAALRPVPPVEQKRTAEERKKAEAIRLRPAPRAEEREAERKKEEVPPAPAVRLKPAPQIEREAKRTAEAPTRPALRRVELPELPAAPTPVRPAPAVRPAPTIARPTPPTPTITAETGAARIPTGKEGRKVAIPEKPKGAIKRGVTPEIEPEIAGQLPAAPVAGITRPLPPAGQAPQAPGAAPRRQAPPAPPVQIERGQIPQAEIPIQVGKPAPAPAQVVKITQPAPIEVAKQAAIPEAAPQVARVLPAAPVRPAPRVRVPKYNPEEYAKMGIEIPAEEMPEEERPTLPAPLSRFPTPAPQVPTPAEVNLVPTPVGPRIPGKFTFNPQEIEQAESELKGIERVRAQPRPPALAPRLIESAEKLRKMTPPAAQPAMAPIAYPHTTEGMQAKFYDAVSGRNVATMRQAFQEIQQLPAAQHVLDEMLEAMDFAESGEWDEILPPARTEEEERIHKLIQRLTFDIANSYNLAELGREEGREEAISSTEDDLENAKKMVSDAQRFAELIPANQPAYKAAQKLARTAKEAVRVINENLEAYKKGAPPARPAPKAPAEKQQRAQFEDLRSKFFDAVAAGDEKTMNAVYAQADEVFKKLGTIPEPEKEALLNAMDYAIGKIGAAEHQPPLEKFQASVEKKRAAWDQFELLTTNFFTARDAGNLSEMRTILAQAEKAFTQLKLVPQAERDARLEEMRKEIDKIQAPTPKAPMYAKLEVAIPEEEPEGLPAGPATITPGRAAIPLTPVTPGAPATPQIKPTPVEEKAAAAQTPTTPIAPTPSAAVLAAQEVSAEEKAKVIGGSKAKRPKQLKELLKAKAKAKRVEKALQPLEQMAQLSGKVVRWDEKVGAHWLQNYANAVALVQHIEELAKGLPEEEAVLKRAADALARIDSNISLGKGKTASIAMPSPLAQPEEKAVAAVVHQAKKEKTLKIRKFLTSKGIKGSIESIINAMSEMAQASNNLTDWAVENDVEPADVPREWQEIITSMEQKTAEIQTIAQTAKPIARLQASDAAQKAQRLVEQTKNNVEKYKKELTKLALRSKTMPASAPGLGLGGQGLAAQAEQKAEAAPGETVAQLFRNYIPLLQLGEKRDKQQQEQFEQLQTDLAARFPNYAPYDENKLIKIGEDLYQEITNLDRNAFDFPGWRRKYNVTPEQAIELWNEFLSAAEKDRATIKTLANLNKQLQMHSYSVDPLLEAIRNRLEKYKELVQGEQEHMRLNEQAEKAIEGTDSTELQKLSELLAKHRLRRSPIEHLYKLYNELYDRVVSWKEFYELKAKFAQAQLIDDKTAQYNAMNEVYTQAAEIFPKFKEKSLPENRWKALLNFMKRTVDRAGKEAAKEKEGKLGKAMQLPVPGKREAIAKPVTKAK